MTGRRLPDHIIARLTRTALDGAGIEALRLIQINDENGPMTPLEVFAEIACGDFWRNRALTIMERADGH